ncbi:hypothetical protein D1007_60165 [Hordeum vulgare]|nr:hypothetical protein D1007_60165 [Hordeum vulgare]
MMPPTASLPAPTSSLQHSRHLRRKGAPESPSSRTGARRRAAAPAAGLDRVSMRRVPWPRRPQLSMAAPDLGRAGLWRPWPSGHAQRQAAPSAAALVAALRALYPWRPWPPIRTCRRIPRTPAPSMPTAPAPSPQATTAHSAAARHSRQRRRLPERSMVEAQPWPPTRGVVKWLRFFGRQDACVKAWLSPASPLCALDTLAAASVDLSAQRCGSRLAERQRSPVRPSHSAAAASGDLRVKASRA